MAKFKPAFQDKYTDESFDEYYDRIYKNDPEKRKRAPKFGDDSGKGMEGGLGLKSDIGKPVSQRKLTPRQLMEAAEAPVRRAEERIRREIAEEEEAKKQGKPKRKVYKAGGYVKAADGCAKKGKTRGRMV